MKDEGGGCSSTHTEVHSSADWDHIIAILNEDLEIIGGFAGDVLHQEPINCLFYLPTGCH